MESASFWVLVSNTGFGLGWCSVEQFVQDTVYNDIQKESNFNCCVTFGPDPP